LTTPLKLFRLNILNRENSVISGAYNGISGSQSENTETEV
jgi:hypothetical protein